MTHLNAMFLKAGNLAVKSDAAGEAQGKPFLLSLCETLDAVRLVVVGHSHSMTVSHAFIRPLEAGEPPSKAYDLARQIGLAGLCGTGWGTARWIPRVAVELGRTKGIAIVWHGSQVHQDFLFAGDPPLDLVPAGFPETPLAPGARIVPETAIREHFKSTLRDLETLLRRLGPSSSDRPRLVLGTPPTIADDDVFQKTIAAQGHFAARAKAGGFDIDTTPMTPAIVRLKLWWVLQTVMAQTAANHGAIFLPVPRAACDAPGFLKPELAGADATHAKVSYGRLVIETIAAQVLDGADGR